MRIQEEPMAFNSRPVVNARYFFQELAPLIQIAVEALFLLKSRSEINMQVNFQDSPAQATLKFNLYVNY